MEQQVTTPTASTLTVKKRNGQLVPFFEVRIRRAIESACKESLDLPQEVALDAAWEFAVDAVTARVVGWCQDRTLTQPILFIEDIQDAVIAQLREAGYPQIAVRYAAYRREQEQKRFESTRLTVEKRDGRKVSFKPEKISIAIGKAFAAGQPGVPLTAEQQAAVLDVADAVVEHLKVESRSVRTAPIEAIQDLVEQTLMARGFHDVAKRYIVYREERRRARAEPPAQPEPLVEKERLLVQREDGTSEHLDLERLKLSIAEVCHGLEDHVSVEQILRRTVKTCFNGMLAKQLHEAMVMAVRSLIESEPAYSFVAARLLLRQGYREALGHPVTFKEMRAEYPAALRQSLEAAVQYDRLNPKLLTFDLVRLGRALQPERDLQFGYMGLQTLYDRYFIHVEGRRIETPQVFWMRVAMGLALNEGDQKDDRAIEFYDALSSFRFISSTPTLFNAGTLHPQLSSCFLTTVGDDLDNIFKSIKDNAMLSKWSGGLGNDWTPVRALGSRIKGTNGKSQGVVPFLKVANDTAVAVNQGGKRQGAVCAYLEVWHLDIEEFLELRKNTGDERRRTHDMHTANWIPDLFMKRVLANADWTLFSPHDVPDLHDLYGRAFEGRYVACEAIAKQGALFHKVIPAVQLWRKMLGMLFETGHPWITFKDPSNIRSPQDHTGVVHSSNLCTEILLNTTKEETAVCNLGSLNLAAHVSSAGLEREQLAQTVRTAVRMLDNVIDVNYYPTEDARLANQRHRPVGLELMGFQDVLCTLGLSYASPQAADFADESMEFIAYHAILASSELAAERGPYSTYRGSKWDRGLLPIDTIELLRQERGGQLDMEPAGRMDWTPVREAIARHGMRNSNVMAIAPTATIANIVGVTQSIEPAYKNLYVKSNLSGEFTVITPSLIEELRALGLWDEAMIQDLKYFDGCLQEIPRVPESLKSRYATAFEIGFEWLIECASRRQKWIDMGQSLNLYMAEPSGKKLHAMYLMAWEKGLKTTYYLRSLGATRVEKSTMDVNKYGNPLGQACNVANKDECEACQ